MEFVVEIKQKNKWAGTVTMVIPSHPQRLTALAKHGAHKMASLAKSIKGGESESAEVAEQFFEKQLPILVPLYEESVKPLIKAVCIVSPDGGSKVETLEEMECHPELAQVWMQLVFQYIAGFGPGKPKSQS